MLALNVMKGRERFGSHTFHKHISRISPNVFRVATFNFACVHSAKVI